MKVFNDLEKLNSDHASIFNSHLTGRAIFFESIKNSNPKLFDDKYQAFKVLTAPEILMKRYQIMRGTPMCPWNFW
jgi:hypothetical protein